tara:strand:+ start:2631 stop:3374 length:744 start_codon:yes stop_codon:yes gene_type:complete
MSQQNLYINNYKKYKGQEIIIYPHLGLGDMIICNGLVNKLGNYFSKINLIVDKKFHKQAEHLYSLNSDVKIVSENPVEVNNLDEFVHNFSLNNNLEILRVSQIKSGKPFYHEFYKSVKLSYKHSYKAFKLPEDIELQDKLKNHLIKSYNVDPLNYALVHRDSSNKSYDLKIENLNKIYVEEKTDLFKNIFLYKDLIRDAKEIHCINSSFLHLVDRVDTNAKLYYHDVRGGIIKLKKKWKIEYYENKD